MRGELHAAIYDEVPGGTELVRYFGQVPTFGDAEVLSLRLERDGPSELRVHGWVTEDQNGMDGAPVIERHAVVTFSLTGVVDLQLDGFSIQNVIGGLILRRAHDRAGRRNDLALESAPADIEIRLEPCFGLNGSICARSVAIAFEAGEPSARDA